MGLHADAGRSRRGREGPLTEGGQCGESDGIYDCARQDGTNGIQSDSWAAYPLVWEKLITRQAIDFTALTSQSRKFFATTLTELLVSSQTASPLFHLPKHLRVEDFDGDAVIGIFEKVLSHEGLTHGLTYVLKNLESRRSQGTDRDRIISEGISIATSVLTGRTTF